MLGAYTMLDQEGNQMHDHGVFQECSSIPGGHKQSATLPAKANLISGAKLYVLRLRPRTDRRTEARSPWAQYPPRLLFDGKGMTNRLACSCLLESGGGHTTDGNACVYGNAVRYTDMGVSRSVSSTSDDGV